MKYAPYYLPLFLLCMSISACKRKEPMVHQPKEPVAQQPPATRDTRLPIRLKPWQMRIADSTSAHNCRLVADSIMPKYKALVKYYFKKYRSDTCMTISLDSAEFQDNEGVQPFGRIRVHQPPVSVFVWPRISYCDMDGYSYYFTDTTLPRLETETVCSHPQMLFPVADIDEDGVSEIGLYFTTCTSHVKSLHVYSLKNGAWEEVGHSMFDLFYMNPEKGLRKFVRKTGKGRFEILEQTDSTVKEEDWQKFSF